MATPHPSVVHAALAQHLHESGHSDPVAGAHGIMQLLAALFAAHGEQPGAPPQAGPMGPQPAPAPMNQLAQLQGLAQAHAASQPQLTGYGR